MCSWGNGVLQPTDPIWSHGHPFSGTDFPRAVEETDFFHQAMAVLGQALGELKIITSTQ